MSSAADDFLKHPKKQSLPSISPDVGEEDLSEEIDNVVPTRGYSMVPIVGLGGSAGAIKTLQAFFQAMPSDSGMAFVVIMHLAPDHESTLSDVLARSTRMRVLQATDGQKVERDCVYVIPPGKFLTLEDESLRLTNLESVAGKRVTVDLFLRALADTHGSNSRAIILSGADGDGALGIKRIKERGGLTIAQDPEEAEYTGMPRSAIETGMVDWVLKVQEMPGRLIAYQEYEKRIKPPSEEPVSRAHEKEKAAHASEPAFRETLAYLRTRTGRDFSYYKRATIVRRLSRRMQVNGVEDVPGYLSYLRTHPGEAGALLQDLLISVTNFFRDRDAFTALEGHIPSLFKDKTSADVLRVWVPACATGDEAYSLAILLMEHARTLDDPPGLQIFATDLDQTVIQSARLGFYPETITADVSEDRLRRFFTKEAHGYRVRREVREIVLFAVQDLLKDSPFSRLDMISCRNLLIYLNRKAQAKALEIIHFALLPNALLFLGVSESVGDSTALFQALDTKSRIYSQIPSGRTRLAPIGGGSALSRALEDPGSSKPAPPMPTALTNTFRKTLPPVLHGLILGEADRASWAEVHFRMLERLGPPSIIINRNHDILHLSESAGKFLNVAGGEPTTNLMRLANASLRAELRSALNRAAESKAAAHVYNVPIAINGIPYLVDITASTASDLGDDLFLITLTSRESTGPSPAQRPAEAAAVVQQLEKEVERLRTELNETVDQYEGTTEELKASNEELQAINEELRTATEELETSREELQSMNEELGTVNNELKLKVEEVGQSNSDLHNLMAATAIATVFVDRDLHIVRFTPSALSIFRLIPTDVGRPLSDLTHHLVYPELLNDAEMVVSKLAPIEREVQNHDGQWFLVRALPYRTLDDHIEGVVLTFIDITRRKRAEESLLVSNERLRLMVENAREFAIFATDMERRVIAWNSGGERLLLYKESEILGRSADIVFTPEDRAAGAPEAEARLAEAEGRAADERWHQRRDGSRFWASGFLMSMRTATGEPCGFVKILHDRTKAKETEEALQQSRAQLVLALKETEKARKEAEDAGKTKDRFLAILSHELRTPLTPIMMAAESLLRRKDLPARVVDAMEMIRRNIEVETHFIDDLLDITRISRGTLELRRLPMDVHLAVQRAVEIVEERFKAKHQRLTVRLTADRCEMRGDFQRVQQTFWNLLINASKFTPEGGSIDISSRVEDSNICVIIHDTGRGIDPNALPSIFEAFKQGDESIAREHGGLGLGLAIAKATVEALGGKIDAASEGPNRGSTFTVSLPLTDGKKGNL